MESKKFFLIASGNEVDAGPPMAVNAQYRFGIVNNEGWLEYESAGQSVFGLKDSPGDHPTVLFSWPKLVSEKIKFLSGDRLCIRCEITTLDLDQDNFWNCTYRWRSYDF